MFAEFVQELATEGGKRGLWVFGPRKAGSSRLVKDFVDGHSELWEKGPSRRRTAHWLDEQTRDLWKLDALLRANGHDLQLFLDNREVELKLQKFWSASALWVDDLWPEYDGNFVRKNILVPISVAMKAGQIVLVSGACAPTHYGEDWRRVIEHDFHVVPLTAPS